MLLRKMGAVWHRLISKLPLPLTRTYLIVVGLLLKRLSDTLGKQRIVNSISEGTWDTRLTFPPRQVRLGNNCSVWLTPHLNEFDGNALFFQQLPYEVEVFNLIETRFHSYDAVVEIGANVGVFTLFLGTLARKMQKLIPVFAFEPSRQAYQRLLANLEHNSLLDTVTPFNVAVAEHSGFMSFYEPDGHLTNGSLSKDFSQQFSDTVQTRTVFALGAAQLEELLRPYSRILLKIDVEGAEPIVLQALHALVQTKQPEIILEVLPATQDALNAISFLQETYQFARITPNGLMHTPQFVADIYRDYWLKPRPNSHISDT